ncbi:MAG TPA: polyribonucleotide nucleotidyltransferase [bacterium]
MQRHVFETELGGRPLILETDWLAKQANGACLIKYGDTHILVTAVGEKGAAERDFFPLTVNYQEKFFASGKIPGGYLRREGRVGDHETLICRLIDRTLRPLFDNRYQSETQIIATVYSLDPECTPDTVAMIGASAALTLSDLPFLGPIAAVRIGRVNGRFVVNPSLVQLEDSELNLVVSGTRDAINMVEAGANEVSETVMIDALTLAHDEIRRLCDVQLAWAEGHAKAKRDLPEPQPDPELDAIADQVRAFATPRLAAANVVKGKFARYAAIDQVAADTLAELDPEGMLRGPIAALLHDLETEVMRRQVVEEGVRSDGRKTHEIRAITCEVGLLPRVHGSGLFTRGETQGLVTCTLGVGRDAQRVDTIYGDLEKPFMLHYNFPPFCVGEAKMLRSPGRREIGHGALAERAIVPVLPSQDEFPYVVRIVSEILESNGSSSMATVCGSTLALMDAGVPIKRPVSGIAMGLIKEGDKIAILSDILGVEDHLGDMDFKVCGTERGITALQMDIKISGVTREVLEQSLGQAKEGRLFILGKMAEAIREVRPELSSYAPRITTLKVHPDKIREIIGPGGKMIRSIQDASGCKIDVEDDGTVRIASTNAEAAAIARNMIEGIVEEAQVGKIYEGTVRKIMDFGAFVEVLPGTDGLVHISQIANERVENVRAHLKEGQKVRVKCIRVDNNGKISLSMKEVEEGKKEKAGAK